MRKSFCNLKKFSFASALLLAILSIFSLAAPNLSYSANTDVSGKWTIYLNPSTFLISSGVTITDVFHNRQFSITQSSKGDLKGSSLLTTLSGTITGNKVFFIAQWEVKIGWPAGEIGFFTGTVSKNMDTIVGTFSSSFFASDPKGEYTGKNSGKFSIVLGATKQTPSLAINNGATPNAVGEPINPVNGNMYDITHDLTLPGRLLKFDFSRTYNNQENSTLGPLGYGWTHSYNVYLTLDTENGIAKIRDEQAKEYLFAVRKDGTYLSQYGDYSSLTKTKTSFIWRKKDGKQYIFDLTGKLLQIKDRNNNSITLSYDSQNKITRITDTAGRLINLTYNSQNLLSRSMDYLSTDQR